MRFFFLLRGWEFLIGRIFNFRKYQSIIYAFTKKIGRYKIIYFHNIIKWFLYISYICADNDSGSATESVSEWIRNDNTRARQKYTSGDHDVILTQIKK